MCWVLVLDGVEAGADDAVVKVGRRGMVTLWLAGDWLAHGSGEEVGKYERKR